jgi:hypothetical protein
MLMDYLKGALLGVLTPLIVVPLVLLIIGWAQGYSFERLWSEFVRIEPYRIKIITISIIANLGWFYFFLNREYFNIGKGIIIGSLLYAPYIMYIKFF